MRVFVYCVCVYIYMWSTSRERVGGFKGWVGGRCSYRSTVLVVCATQHEDRAPFATAEAEEQFSQLETTVVGLAQATIVPVAEHSGGFSRDGT